MSNMGSSKLEGSILFFYISKEGMNFWMIDTGYLYSKDNKRIFVNTCLGCCGKCSYCYNDNSIASNVRKSE